MPYKVKAEQWNHEPLQEPMKQCSSLSNERSNDFVYKVCLACRANEDPPTSSNLQARRHQSGKSSPKMGLLTVVVAWRTL